MATLDELRQLFNEQQLINKTQSAVIIAAVNILATSPTADEQTWAASVFKDPKGEAQKAWMFLLGDNSAATPSQIQNADDATIQAKVNAVVPHLVVAKAAGG